MRQRIFNIVLWQVFGLCILPGLASAKANQGPGSDSLIFLVKQLLAAKSTTPVEKTLGIARSFLGAPYMTGTLDQHEREQLVVNLRALDCWTFVENCVALEKTSESGGDFQAYQNTLRQLRYWGGTVSGYGSRIHYFTGWVLQAEKTGYLSDITRKLGGVPYQKKIQYISTHAADYPMTAQPGALQAIRRAETRINAHPWYFIPKKKVRAMERQIRDGDIILLCSSKKGLDVAHEGFAVRQNGRIHLLHASSLLKQVVISSEPLHEYLAGQPGQSGIMVIRLADK
jgi:hypothetical protein